MPDLWGWLFERARLGFRQQQQLLQKLMGVMLTACKHRACATTDRAD
jgi:hypothetical protein